MVPSANSLTSDLKVYLYFFLPQVWRKVEIVRLWFRLARMDEERLRKRVFFNTIGDCIV